MRYQWIGAILIIVSCGGFGLGLARAHHREESALRQLIAALDFMECELQYRLTPLPELCRQAGQESRGEIRKVFLKLSGELDAQIAPEVSSCMEAALSAVEDLPGEAMKILRRLGSSLGRFDLAGQLKGMESVRMDCRRVLEGLEQNKTQRLRGYQTLGFCAGTALVILLA